MRSLKSRRFRNCGAQKSRVLPKSNASWDFTANERGSATLVGVLLMGILTSYLCYQILSGKYTLGLIKERSDTYLCYRQVTTYFKSYVEVIAGANLVIDAAVAGTVLTVGALAPKTIHVIKAAKRLQDLTHMFLIFKIMNSKFCHELQKIAILRGLPYQTSGLIKLKRPYYFNAVTRRHKWNLTLAPTLKRIKVDPINTLAIKIKFSLAGFFDPLIGYEAQEVSAGKYLQLSSRSGWFSSH